MCDVHKMKLRVRCKTPEEPKYVFIAWKKENIGVCEKCWARIAEKDWEIGVGPKPTMEELLSDLARFGHKPIPTEYEYRGKRLALDGEEEKENSWRKGKV